MYVTIANPTSAFSEKFVDFLKKNVNEPSGDNHVASLAPYTVFLNYWRKGFQVLIKHSMHEDLALCNTVCLFAPRKGGWGWEGASWISYIL